MKLVFESSDGLKIPKGTAIQICEYPIFVGAGESAKLCKAWISLVNERGIVSQYVPHYSDRECLCAWRFPLPHRDAVFGLIVSVLCKVDPKSEQQLLSVYVHAGQDRESEEVLHLTSREVADLLHTIEELIGAVDHRLSDNPTPHHVVRFLEGVFSNDRTICHEDTVFFKTRRYEGHVVTPVSLSVRGFSSTDSWSEAMPRLAQIQALMEVVLGQRVDVFSVPHQGKKEEDLCCYEQAPTEDDVSRLIGDPASTLPLPLEANVSDRLPIVMRIQSSGKLACVSQIENALYAFHEGLHVKDKAPTLGALAFFASLASFAKEKACEGQVTCSKCGSLRKHSMTGEVNRILEELAEAFGECQWPREDLRKLLRSFHEEQRSAFVHRAKRAVSRRDSQEEWVPLWPGKKSPLHPDVTRLEEISTVERLSRIAILRALSDFDSAIVSLLDEQRSRFRPTQLGPSAVLRLPWAHKPIHMGVLACWPEEFSQAEAVEAQPDSFA